MSNFLKCSRILRLNSSLTCRRDCSSVANKGLVLGVYSKDGKDMELTPSAENYNNVTNGKLLENICLAGEVKEGKHFTFYGLNTDYKCVTVVGLGDKDKSFDAIERICEKRESVRAAAGVGAKAQNGLGIKEICIDSMEDPEAAAEGSNLGIFKFQEYKSEKKEPTPLVDLYKTCNTDETACDWEKGVVKARGQNLARILMETPANLMTPEIFAQRAVDTFKGTSVSVEVHDKQWAESKKMFSFLSVSRGSDEPPKFLELTYNPSDSKSKPFVFVGKGVTFDSGGISIKPSAGMDLMRADMGGAACLVGMMQAIDGLKLNAHVKVLIPLCENMPNGRANKPGDVVTAMNGKSICINNTDAEGRLILADALCYSGSFNPECVVDIATLTGAMMVAVGSAATGAFTNCEKMYEILEEAGSNTGDRVWQFPLWKHYKKQVTHSAAYDVDNVGKAAKGAGGACTAAAFLKEFVPEKVKWMHLDMAGVMGWEDDPVPYLSGMTGRPTRTLVKFVELQTGSCK